mgnify:CR=1 FL=1
MKDLTDKLLDNGLLLATLFVQTLTAAITTTTYVTIVYVIDWIETHL